MKVKEHYMETHMEQERQQQEMEEHLYFMTRKALIAAGAHLPDELFDVLLYQCGFNEDDLFPKE